MAKQIYEFKPEDAERFAYEQGITTTRKGEELQFKECPYCHGGDRGKDKYTFAINLKTGRNNCKRASCGAHGNMITLARDFGFSLGRDVDEYYSEAKRFRRIHRKDKPLPVDEVTAYFNGRGISAEIVRKYNLTGRKDDHNVAVFPFYDENEVLTFAKYRRIDFDPAKHTSKEWCEPNCKPILFGMNHCDPEVSKTLVMTEGQIDSLSVAEAGVPNAVSVPTGKNGFTWVPYCWDWLGQFEELIVFGDCERGEITLLPEMAARFHGTVKHVRIEDYKGCKDANELLLTYTEEAVRNAVKNAVPVANPRIIPLASVERMDMSQVQHFSTGFGQLDRLLGGYYFGQLVLLTGERGNGKSTLAGMIAIRSLQAGFPVFFYSGELEDWYFRNWFDRQVAGRNYITSTQSENGFVDYSVKDEFIPYISKWYDGKAYLYNNRASIEDGEGADVIETIESSVKQYGCQTIIIDNLMTAMSDDTASDYYRLQSEFVRKLADMAKRLGVLIILVAHPRKTGTADIETDDVSGSGNITNLADVVLCYTRPRQERKKGGKKNQDDEDDEDTDERVLKVLKNRLNGRINTNGIPMFFEEASKRITDGLRNFAFEVGWEPSEDKKFAEWDEAPDEIPF